MIHPTEQLSPSDETFLQVRDVRLNMQEPRAVSVSANIRIKGELWTLTAIESEKPFPPIMHLEGANNVNITYAQKLNPNKWDFQEDPELAAEDIKDLPWALTSPEGAQWEQVIQQTRTLFKHISSLKGAFDRALFLQTADKE